MDVVILEKVGSQVDLNTAALKYTFHFAQGAKIVVAGLILETNNSVSNCVVKFSLANAGASITASGDVAVIKVPASSIGKLVYADLDDSSIEVLPGQCVQVEVTTGAGSALNAVPVLKYSALDELLANAARAVLSA